MVLKYTWLRTLDLLKKRGSRVSFRDLYLDLDSRGFRLESKELVEDLARRHEIGLLEADLLTSTDGTPSLTVDEFSHVGITAAGTRKLTAIIKI